MPHEKLFRYSISAVGGIHIANANETLNRTGKAGNWRTGTDTTGLGGTVHRGGKTLEPADLSEYATISFWVNIYWNSSNTNPKELVAPLTFKFELRNGGSRTSKTDGTYFVQNVVYDPDNLPAGWEKNADGWVKVVLNLNSFTGLDVTNISGYAFEVIKASGGPANNPTANDMRLSLTRVVAE